MADKMEVLVSGASGFVGQALVKNLRDLPELRVSGSVRSAQRNPIDGMLEIGDIHSKTDWSALLRNKKVVIHTAALLNSTHDEVADRLAAFREVNTAGTLNFARQAAAAGVRRFVFISSIKVNGEQTLRGVPFKEGDAPDPSDAYAISKLEAEQGLWEIGRDTDMEIVVIRPPLVYGPGVKGNFASLVALVCRGLPLPLGAVENKRSFVSLKNLVDLVTVCMVHPKAANQLFLVSDGDDLSTPELLRRVATAVEKTAILIPVPNRFLEFAAFVLGRKMQAQRLLGSLQVDITKVRDLLNWEPPISVDEGLRRCCEAKRDY
ncbi:SDR family oxidoreductase [Marinobacter sp. M-5]|uniref:UDP-glucose 4-epimerase family protein n=1 Tax=Marinobacter sp. M-5 TaxID=3081089 RepID=UPI00293CB027|nr:SDR family oxidoreductase [Marinobacter sp. M-5]MDV3503114.1 SDR family oxidoreductase [Marinobacter sp. M-5]